MVMISGLNNTKSMNGVEFEVITVPAKNQFTVQHAVSPTPGDISGANNAGTVRNLTAPGRLRIVPAVSTPAPDPLNDNQETFSGTSAYTIKEEASSIVFRYRCRPSSRLPFVLVTRPIPEILPPGTLLDPADAAKNFAEIRFDNRGFPKSTLVGNAVPNTTTTNTTILIAEKDSERRLARFSM